MSADEQEDGRDIAHQRAETMESIPPKALPPLELMKGESWSDGRCCFWPHGISACSRCQDWGDSHSPCHSSYDACNGCGREGYLYKFCSMRPTNPPFEPPASPPLPPCPMLPPLTPPPLPPSSPPSPSPLPPSPSPEHPPPNSTASFEHHTTFAELQSKCCFWPKILSDCSACEDWGGSTNGF